MHRLPILYAIFFGVCLESTASAAEQTPASSAKYVQAQVSQASADAITEAKQTINSPM